MSLDDFYFAINDVRPSLIRVEADEATYNLHILIRFELEQALLADDLTVADLPAAWNEKYQRVPGHRAAQRRRRRAAGHPLERRADRLLSRPTRWAICTPASSSTGRRAAWAGSTRSSPAANSRRLRAWLREKIHRHGQCYTAAELVEKVTGKPLSHQPLVAHLRRKLAPLYGLD